MAAHSSPSTTNKLHLLLIPYFATSHIEPFTELAIRLITVNNTVEATITVTPANVSIVETLLSRHNAAAAVKIVTYPFPRVDGLPRGVENLGKAASPEESLRIRLAGRSEDITRPAQEELIRAMSPDAIITDMLFFWNGNVADELRVPCVAFSVMGAFSMLAVKHLTATVGSDDTVMEVPGFPSPPIRIPRAELPECLRSVECTYFRSVLGLQSSCFGLAMNTPSELEKTYCELYTSTGYVNRAYFLGPLALGLPAAPPASPRKEHCLDWLDSKPLRSVVYISFGSLTHVSHGQLDEMASGLEASAISFLWVVRGADSWSPPMGWEDRLNHTGLIIRTWAPQKAILAHPAVGAFLTQCGWNSVMETVAAGVPMLTWPMFFEQFITERQVTEVLRIGERLWPDGAGMRSESYDEHEVVPSQAVAHALCTFMKPGGPGHKARSRVQELSVKLHAAVAEGGSSYSDLHRLVNDLLAAKRI
ncbi:unnamed protein product [Alopecurus aequalis]